jgi:hypothetical protein
MSLLENDAPLACNLDAIRLGDRPRYAELVTRLRAALTDRIELPNGYAYRLDLGLFSLPELAEWVTLERLCCPFLSFQIDIPAKGASRLTLRGPKGVKALLQEEFQS